MCILHAAGPVSPDSISLVTLASRRRIQILLLTYLLTSMTTTISSFGLFDCILGFMAFYKLVLT